MIKWLDAANKLGYPSEHEMWSDLYLAQGLSVLQLAERLGVSRNTVREALSRHGITPRQRGGANNQKVFLTDEIIERVRVYGIAQVARELKVAYATLYKRLYQAKPKSLAELFQQKKAQPKA